MRRHLPVLLLLCLSAVGVARAEDRVDIDRGAQIIGNRELPKVLYIVPWKKATQGEVIAGRPLVSVLNDEPAPLTREALRRQIQNSSSQATTPRPGASTEPAPR